MADIFVLKDVVDNNCVTISLTTLLNLNNYIIINISAIK